MRCLILKCLNKNLWGNNFLNLHDDTVPISNKSIYANNVLSLILEEKYVIVIIIMYLHLNYQENHHLPYDLRLQMRLQLPCVYEVDAGPSQTFTNKVSILFF